MASRRWQQFHRQSGATGFERRVAGCTVLVYPRDWTNRNGPATYTASCYGQNKRGEAKTLSAAKSKGLAVARRMRAKARG